MPPRTLWDEIDAIPMWSNIGSDFGLYEGRLARERGSAPLRLRRKNRVWINLPG
jgi:hypothetical protein